MVEIGQKVKFNPFREFDDIDFEYDDVEVVAEVSYINEKHRWFEVEYKEGNETLRIGFNFADMFHNVWPVD